MTQSGHSRLPQYELGIKITYPALNLLMFATPFFGVSYLLWLWATPSAKDVPRAPFWSRSKGLAIAVFCGAYIPFVLVIPESEFEIWGEFVAIGGIASLAIVMFPEISRVYMTGLTARDLTSVQVTSGLGWSLLVLWVLATIVIDIAYLV